MASNEHGDRAREIAQLEEEGVRAMQTGDAARAEKAWQRLVAIAPNHARAWTQIGQNAFRVNEFARARDAFQRAANADGSEPRQWVNVALACKNLKDDAGEEAAIERALQIDAMDLLALVLRAGLFERKGLRHKAAAAHAAVVSVSPPLEQLHPDLRGAVSYAYEYKVSYDNEFGAHLDRYLASHFDDTKGEDLKRFRDSVDMMVGRKRRYESQSMVFHYHGLAPVEFFPRAQFPWLDAFEASTSSIHAEFQAVLAEDAGFTPYIQYGSDMPLNQWAELNHNPNWSAYHLLKQGERVAGNADKCPKTMSLLAGAPQPEQKGRTPAAMFSLLKPKTKIPPHTGVSNVRLVVHLPLVVPPDCGFRVGNETREWKVGEAWVFDDTIEHEAWNNSDQLRTVFIFDTWHPALSEAERRMITALSKGIESFVGQADDFAL
jgi:aspartate beta-hydroxylase